MQQLAPKMWEYFHCGFTRMVGIYCICVSESEMRFSSEGQVEYAELDVLALVLMFHQAARSGHHAHLCVSYSTKQMSFVQGQHSQLVLSRWESSLFPASSQGE